MLINTPPFYGETTPAPDQRGGVGVDDRLMKQPWLSVNTRVPTGNLKIDKFNPITKNLFSAVLPGQIGQHGVDVSGFGPFQHINRSYSWPVSVIDEGQPSIFMQHGWYGTSCARGRYLSGSSTSGCTLATVVKVASPIHDWNFAVSSIGTGGAAGSVLSINAFSLGRIGTVRYSDDYLYATENVITTTRYHSIVISANGKDERLYVDGVKIGSRTSANNQIINAGAYHYIGTSSWNWVYTNQGWYKRMECIWLRQLSDAEAISWTKNPYQFLIPA